MFEARSKIFFKIPDDLLLLDLCELAMSESGCDYIKIREFIKGGITHLKLTGRLIHESDTDLIAAMEYVDEKLDSAGYSPVESGFYEP